MLCQRSSPHVKRMLSNSHSGLPASLGAYHHSARSVTHARRPPSPRHAQGDTLSVAASPYSSASPSEPEPRWKTRSCPTRVGETRCDKGEGKTGGGGECGGRRVLALVCNGCAKPNTLRAHSCTGCGFPLDPLQDIRSVPANPFEGVLLGISNDHRVLFRDEAVCVLENRFPAARTHLLAMPSKRAIAHVGQLTGSDLQLVDRMYAAALGCIPGANAYGDRIHAGFNVPPTIDYLHMHVALDPFREESMRSSRFYTYERVRSDLVNLGRVNMV